MKKITISVFLFLVSISLCTVALAQTFTDAKDHRYETAILYLKAKNIAQGYPDGTFKPNRTINRAEFVKILIGSLLEESPGAPTRNCFSDVPRNAWFAPFICYAQNQKIIDGYGDGTFKPSQEINLAEASKIIVNAMKVNVDPETPKSPWYRPFIQTLQDDTYLPVTFTSLSQKVKRGEMAEMIWRIRENIRNQPTSNFSFDTAQSDEMPSAGNLYGFCPVPLEAQEEDVSHPTTVIGNGTPQSCTSSAVVAAVARGGVITFNCGNDPVTIPMEQTAKIFNNASPEVVIDGGGLVTLDGQNERRILYMNTCDRDQVWTTPHCNNQDHPRLTVQNLTFMHGKVSGRENTDGGAAIFARGGNLKIINSRFFNNTCESTGPDVGGAAVRAFDQFNGAPLYVVGSTFGGAEGYGNTCSNGGGLSSIGVSYTVINSLFSHNSAIGYGANPAKAGTPGGGNGGAIYNDGNTYTLDICGTDIHDNHAREGGGAIIFVSNDLSGKLKITNSTLKNNPSDGFETQGYPGIFYLGNGDPQIKDSDIRR